MSKHKKEQFFGRKFLISTILYNVINVYGRNNNLQNIIAKVNIFKKLTLKNRSLIN